MNRMLFSAVVLVIIAIVSCIPHRSNAGYKDSMVWKASQSGLALGLSNPKGSIIQVSLENRGNIDIAGVIQSPARFIVELNGKYYAIADHGGKSLYMPPGRAYGPLKINISKFREIPELTPQYTIVPNGSHPVFSKGENTLRVHYKLENQLIPSAEIIVKSGAPPTPRQIRIRKQNNMGQRID